MKYVMKHINHLIKGGFYRLGYTIEKREDIQTLGKTYLQEQGIQTIPLIDYYDYRACCPPFFDPPEYFPNMSEPEANKLLLNESMNVYFIIEKTDKGYTLTDNIPIHNPQGESYHNRQYMLFSAYTYFFGKDFRDLSFIDIAGSSGYYAFYAARLGFKNVLCVDGRDDHQAQFIFLKESLALSNVNFRLLNVENLHESITEKFEVVSAQGILYHLYDHALFTRNLYRITGKILILDTLLNGRMDEFLNIMQEDQSCLRDSPFSQLSLAPSLPVVVELLKQAGFRRIYCVPYPGMIKDERGNVIDGNGYGVYQRIMLVATVDEHSYTNK